MQQVSVVELSSLVRQLMQQGLAPVLLDVREPWEIAQASFTPEGMRRLDIPMQQIPARLGELDPEQPVFVLCHHGMRSLQVAHFLERQSHAEVYNIAGGIDAWSNQVDATTPRY
ncbi:rhodanese-related sulfurtransferase [Sphaerotilus hippei]|uniref:Rhodanese-related sulfurtransferase n=1 Tax=Sphaerotilus hippei TaxID=744406 RepID=A0A318GXP4_9BURK|nr:rhodanese-like domain-containing protein [Sphaerotilus hippei]PXW94694.1 rhodanese-related sulfurtransferase [Sphaerotilus hippei]